MQGGEHSRHDGGWNLLYKPHLSRHHLADRGDATLDSTLELRTTTDNPDGVLEKHTVPRLGDHRFRSAFWLCRHYWLAHSISDGSRSSVQVLKVAINITWRLLSQSGPL